MRILCPTDFSSGSQQALRVATRIAKETNAELVLIHVWYTPPMAFVGDHTFSRPAIQQIVDDAQQGLDAAAREASAADAQRVAFKMLNGAPWAEIVSLLEKDAFDLCVIGTHGRTGLGRILLGSVAEKVVRHAPCSVLVVRPDGEVQPFAHVLVPTGWSPDHELPEDPGGGRLLVSVARCLPHRGATVRASRSSVRGASSACGT
jgi:nucleotide-binding universal stress UspA family protein